MLMQLVDRPCNLVSLTSSSLVSMTMSRQLPTLCGRKGHDLFVTGSPPTETTDSLLLVGPPGAFSQLTEVSLDKESEHLCGVAMTELNSLLLVLYNARLSVEWKS